MPKLFLCYFLQIVRQRGIILAGYFGKKSDMIVHHLAERKPECEINFVKKEDRVYFTPDTLENARKKGFTSCRYCC